MSLKGKHRKSRENYEDAPLAGFLPAARAWFEETIGVPSPPQRLGWPPIRRGEHTLVLAPTGTGKTLAAFLWCLNMLFEEPREPTGVRVLYVSPLKALGRDIDRNLKAPLRGIADRLAHAGRPFRKPRVTLRTGDTSASDRRRMLTIPPDILITTPESFYLMLTSAKARAILEAVEYVIIDEIHSMAGNKRGAHLAVSMERLEALTAPRSPVRIGLSATGRPPEALALFLGGYALKKGVPTPREVTVVEAPVARPLEIQVVCPCADLGRLQGGSAWPDVVQDLVRVARASTSVIVFVTMRRQAERLAAQMNDEAGEALAFAHHGSLSPAVRQALEARFKAGEIRCLVATASLELGIDIGSVDMVCQVQSPRTVTAGLQRLGRSGHRLGGTARGRLYVTNRSEIAELAVLARRMKAGALEPVRVLASPLDVLAQQVVAMAATGSWTEEALHAVLRRSRPFVGLTRPQLMAVLGMVGGQDEAFLPGRARPRVSWNRAAGTVNPLRGSRAMALRGGGTIVDTGQFPVYLSGTDVRVGELDEEFVLETRTGDTFRLGSATWTVERVRSEKVEVRQAFSATARLPFWKGGFFSRPSDLARECGALLGDIARSGDGPQRLIGRLSSEYGLDAVAAETLVAFVRDQRRATGRVPDDRTLVIETFPDPSGGRSVVIHALLGKAVTYPWGLALERVLQKTGRPAGRHLATDDGIMFRFDPGEVPPLDRLPRLVSTSELAGLVREALVGSAMFMTSFRNAAVRSLCLARFQGRGRTPLWLLRIKAKDLLTRAAGIEDFPVTVEAFREILTEYLDLDALGSVLVDLAKGEIETVVVERNGPSPFAAAFLFPFENAFFYEGQLPSAEAGLETAELDLSLLSELVPAGAGGAVLEPEVVRAFEAERERRDAGQMLVDEAEMLEHIRAFGDRAEAELLGAASPRVRSVLDTLEAQGAIVAAAGVNGRFYVPRELAPLYRRAATGWSLAAPAEKECGAGVLPAPEKSRKDLLERFLRARGPVRLDAARDRYGWNAPDTERAAEALVEEGKAIRGRLVKAWEDERLCSKENFALLKKQTLSWLRRRCEPVRPAAFAAYLMNRQGVPAAERAGPSGVEGLSGVLARLEGIPCHAAIWEPDLLRVRCRSYEPIWLDYIVSQGEFFWTGGYGRARIAFHQRSGPFVRWPAKRVPGDADPGGSEAQIDPAVEPGDPEPVAGLSPTALEVRRYLEERGASFAFRIQGDLALEPPALVEALWALAWEGWVTNDGFEALRIGIRSGFKIRGEDVPDGVARELPGNLLRTSTELRRRVRRRTARRVMSTPGGRWSLVAADNLSSTEAAVEASRKLVARYGIVNREIVRWAGSAVPWPWMKAVLTRLEEQGRLRSGYFVDGLSAPQFALPEAIEALRRFFSDDGRECEPVLLNCCDPANPYGALFPFPAAWTGSDTQGAMRNTASHIVLVSGEPLCLLDTGRHKLWTGPSADRDVVARACARFADLLRAPSRERKSIRIEEIDGVPALEAPLEPVLSGLGYRRDGRSLRLPRLAYP